MQEIDEEDLMIDPRVGMAAERTLLAWLRTGLAMMGFGFVVARFAIFAHALTPPNTLPQNSSTFATAVGVGLVLTGVVLNGFAAVQHALSLHDRTIVDRRRRISGWVAVILTAFIAFVGIVMTIYLIYAR
jgi:putative membrane protein